MMWAYLLTIKNWRDMHLFFRWFLYKYFGDIWAYHVVANLNGNMEVEAGLGLTLQAVKFGAEKEGKGELGVGVANKNNNHNAEGGNL